MKTVTRAACAQAGLGTLKSLGLLQAAAAKQVDDSTLTVPDLIRADLPTCRPARPSRSVRSSSSTTPTPSCSPGATDLSRPSGGARAAHPLTAVRAQEGTYGQWRQPSPQQVPRSASVRAVRTRYPVIGSR